MKRTLASAAGALLATALFAVVRGGLQALPKGQKDTSLVLNAGKVALADPVWQGYSSEVYIVLAPCFCEHLYRIISKHDPVTL